MKLNLPQEYWDAINSGQIETDFAITIDGNTTPYTERCRNHSYSYDRQFGIAQMMVTLNNNEDFFTPSGTYEIKKGFGISLDESVIHSAGTEDFPKFNGIVDQTTFNDTAKEVTLTCLDNIVKLRNTDIGKSYEAGGDLGGEKIALFPIGGIRLKPNIIDDTSSLSQVWDFVDEDYTGIWNPETRIWDESSWAGSIVTSIARLPAPSLKILSSDVNIKQTIEVPDFNINYQTGQIVFNSPININNNWINVSFAYYPSGLPVENIIIDMIKEPDGYDDPLFTDANLKDEYDNVTKFTTDNLTPNSVAITIEDVLYPAGQLWSFTFNNLTSSGQFDLINDFTISGAATVSSINIEHGLVILNTPLDPFIDTVVCTKSDYEFWTIQSTFIKIDSIRFDDREIENRFDALNKLRDVLPPNYFIRTRGDDKIWGSYISQKNTKDYDLELIKSLDYVGDKQVYTRCVVYGKNESPTNIMSNAIISKPQQFTAYTDQAQLTSFAGYDFANDTITLKPVDPGIIIENIRTTPQYPRLYAGNFNNLENMVQIGRTDIAQTRVSASDIQIIIENDVAIGFQTRAQVSLGSDRNIDVYDMFNSILFSIPDPSTDTNIREEGGWIKYVNQDITSFTYKSISTIYAYLFTDTAFSFNSINPEFYITNPGMSSEDLVVSGAPGGNASFYLHPRLPWEAENDEFIIYWNKDGVHPHGYRAFTFHWKSNSDEGDERRGNVYVNFGGLTIIDSFRFKVRQGTRGVISGTVVFALNGKEVYRREVPAWVRGIYNPGTYGFQITGNNAVVADSMAFYGRFKSTAGKSVDTEIIFSSTRSRFDQPKQLVLTTDYLAQFWYDADVNYDRFEKQFLVDGIAKEQMQLTFSSKPLEDIPILEITFDDIYDVDAIDITNGFYINYESGINEKFDISTTYTLEYTDETGDTPLWQPLSEKSLYFTLGGGESISFTYEDLGGSISIRRLRLILNDVEEVDDSNIWSVSINEIAVYESLLIKGEAKLTPNPAEDSLTLDDFSGTTAYLYDANGILEDNGDILYKEPAERDGLRTQESANERAYYLLREYYKNHDKTSAPIVLSPHLEIGDTVAIPKNDVTPSSENFMLEGVNRSSDTHMDVTLGRYPA